MSCLFRALLLNTVVEQWLMQDLSSQERPSRLDATVLEVMRMTPPVGGFFRRNTQSIELANVAIPQGKVIQVVLSYSGAKHQNDLETFRPQRHLDGSFQQTLLPFGFCERVCLGKALAELEIRLMAVELLQRVQLHLEPDQDLNLQLIPGPTPRDGLLVAATAR